MIAGVAYGITVTLVFGTVWERYNKVVLCILQQDRKTFLYYRDERIPIIVYSLIAALSMPLLLITAALSYQFIVAGAVSVFFVSLILILYWAVIVQLQDPLKSIWLKERIPAEWLKANIDEEFFSNTAHRY